MTISRTAKGYDATLLSGTTLSVANVQNIGGSILFIGIVYDDSQGDPISVKWGNVDCIEVIKKANITNGFTTAIWRAPRIRSGETNDIVVTWSAAILFRAIIVTEIAGASLVDVSASETYDAATHLYTGNAVSTTVAETFHLCFFGINDKDNIGIDAGLNHVIGQEIGTGTAGADIDNCVLVETYESLSIIGDCRASLDVPNGTYGTGIIIALKAANTYRILRGGYIPHDGNPISETIEYVIVNGDNIPLFRVNIPRVEFEAMTDQEVKNKVLTECAWYAQKYVDDGESPTFEPDAAFNTRVASFIDEEFTI